MKPLDLSQFKGITPGSWRIGDAGITIFGPPNGEPSPVLVACCERAKGAVRSNARAIAAVPDLIAELAALRASNAEMETYRAALDLIGHSEEHRISYIKSSARLALRVGLERAQAIRKAPDKTNHA